jgi:methylmalonyl-CoA carboxyltransferase large subunit
MATVTVTDLAGTLVQIQAQMAEICQRLEALEDRNAKRNAGSNGTPVALAAPQPVGAPQVPAAPAPEAITEEELLAISAAIGAYLGVRAHIRQVRLLSTNAWAQQGRVSIQASHSLQG